MKNKYAIGTDIVEVDRIRILNERFRDRFLQHVFTVREVEWCQARTRSNEHLSGRFAAKEAVKKALLTLGESNIPVKAIEVQRKDNQPPKVRILCPLSSNYTFQISISHTEKYATAVAIVELK